LVEEYDLDNATPNEILRDFKIKLKYIEDANEKKVKRRLVSYFQVRKKNLFFLTNLFGLKPQKIAELYKKIRM
jgi:hypothetical protein